MGWQNITEERIKAVLKRQAPNIEPKGINDVESESLEPAMIAVNTSGAPLAKAKKVTPAIVGDISNFQKRVLKSSMNISTVGAK